MDLNEQDEMQKKFAELLPKLSKERMAVLYDLMFLLVHCPRFGEVFVAFVPPDKPAPPWKDTAALVAEWMAKEFPNGAA